MAEEAGNTIIRIAVTLAVLAVVVLFLVWLLGEYTENSCKNAFINNLADLETKACSYHVRAGYADPQEDWLKVGDCVEKFYYDSGKKFIKFTSKTDVEESKAKCPTGEDVIYVGFEEDVNIRGPNVDYPVLIEPGVISLNVVKFQFNLLYSCPYSQCSGGGCDEAVEKLCNSIGLECTQCDVRQTYELTKNAEIEFVYGQVDYTGVDVPVAAYTAEGCGDTFGSQSGLATGAVVGVGGPLYIAPELYNPNFNGQCGARNVNHCCNEQNPLGNAEEQISHCYFQSGTKLEVFSTKIGNKPVVFWCQG